MSFLSGKYDLLNYISGLGGYYDADGNIVESVSNYSGTLYSDIYQDFLEFKKQTGGVLHQYKCIKEITPNNQDFVASKAPWFKVIKHVKKVQDKRRKSGYRETVEYTYSYYGNEYTAKELKKNGGVTITVEIHFDTLLELAMYFPYTVSRMSCTNGNRYIVISDESYVERHYDGLIQSGFETPRDYYNKLLVEYIRDLSFKYFNPSGKEHVETIAFKEHDGKYVGKTSKPIDTDFDVESEDESRTYYSSPKVIDPDKGLIEISEIDFKSCLGDKPSVYYVEKTHKTLYLE